MPFTAGGGVRSDDDVRALLLAGADKVSLNSALFDAPGGRPARAPPRSARNASSRRSTPAGCRRRRLGGHGRGRDAAHRRRAPPTRLAAPSTNGAGEILLTSIDQDGTMEGYDIELIALGRVRRQTCRSSPAAARASPSTS